MMIYENWNRSSYVEIVCVNLFSLTPSIGNDYKAAIKTTVHGYTTCTLASVMTFYSRMFYFILFHVLGHTCCDYNVSIYRVLLASIYIYKAGMIILYAFIVTFRTESQLALWTFWCCKMGTNTLELVDFLVHHLSPKCLPNQHLVVEWQF